MKTAQQNNFSVLRLFFASLVIVSHTPEMIDGDRSREVLTMIFGTLSFGEVAVDGFFLISGYLITKSFLTSSSSWSFIKKRLARIVPGFVVCFFICLLVLAPFLGGSFSVSADILRSNAKMLAVLQGPYTPDILPGLPYPSTNVPMWTIAYEFRCYVLVLVLGVLGVLGAARWRWGILGFAALLLGLNASGITAEASVPFSVALGQVGSTVRLFGVFAVGMCFYLFRDRLTYSHPGAAIAAILLVICLFNRFSAEAAFAIFGGYLIFWFTFKFPALWLSSLADRNDISYGMYLYAWPVGTSLIWLFGMRDPIVVGALTFLITPAFATLSWVLIERPAQQAFRPSANRSATAIS